jgi:glyoxylase I family protein
MINGVHHVSIATTRLEAMLGFYRDLLGLEVRDSMIAPETDAAFHTLVGMKDAGFRGVWLRAGNVEIEFMDYLNPVGRPVEVRPVCDAGLRHICFDVTDVQGEYERLLAAGVEFISPPQYMPGAEVITVYARDPEGNVVELQELLPGTTLEPISTFAPLN